MTNPPAWRTRPYRSGDERELVALWTQAFGRTMTEDQWRWKAKGRPSPVENVGVAAAAFDDRPIFQFVGIPCPAVVLGEHRMVMVGADVVTSPAFRRRGVFTSTVRELFREWRAAGIALVLGLANDPSWGSRAAALGYERYFQLRWLIRPLRPERVLARKIGIPAIARLAAAGPLWNRLWKCAAPAGIRIEPLSSAGGEVDAVWTGNADSIDTSLMRNASWVRWRYVDDPSGSYHVTLAQRAGTARGYAAWRMRQQDGGTVAHLAEVFAPNDRPALRALIQDVVARAMDSGADSVATLAVPGSDLDRELRGAGFLFSPGAYQLEVVRLDATLPAAQLADPARWWLTGGDFDVI